MYILISLQKPVAIAPKVLQNGPKVDGADVIVIKDGNKTGIVKKSGPVSVVSFEDFVTACF